MLSTTDKPLLVAFIPLEVNKYHDKSYRCTCTNEEKMFEIIACMSHLPKLWLTKLISCG